MSHLAEHFIEIIFTLTEYKFLHYLLPTLQRNFSVDVCLSYGLIPAAKHHDQKMLGKKELIWLTLADHY